MINYIDLETSNAILDVLPPAGMWSTPIPGLSIQKYYFSPNNLSFTLNEFPFFKFINFINEWHVNKLYNFSTLSCYINDKNIDNCKNSDTRNNFIIVISLNISSYILALLSNNFSFIKILNENNICIKFMKDDVCEDLFNSFLRLINLIHKKEQIFIRAPIIISDIHNILILSGKIAANNLSLN